jgi:hypothetical protein
MMDVEKMVRQVGWGIWLVQAASADAQRRSLELGLSGWSVVPFILSLLSTFRRPAAASHTYFDHTL